MVTQYGMSDRFGVMGLATVESQYLEGRAVLNCSDATAAAVDEEVRRMLEECYVQAKAILADNMDALDKIAGFLIEKETITGKEFMKLYREAKGIPEPEEEKTGDPAQEAAPAAVPEKPASAPILVDPSLQKGQEKAEEENPDSSSAGSGTSDWSRAYSSFGAPLGEAEKDTDSFRQDITWPEEPARPEDGDSHGEEDDTDSAGGQDGTDADSVKGKYSRISLDDLDL